MIPHKAVAHGHSEHDEQHDGGVDGGKHQVLAVFRVHVDEAPGPGTVLHILAEPREGQAAEERAQRVHAGDGDVAAASAHAPPVQVRVTDGQVALERHGEQQRERGQAEEGHGKAEELARTLVGGQGNQRGVEPVRGLHERGEQARARQIGDHKRGHEHVEQGASLMLVLPAAALFPSTHLEQEERGGVAQHTGREHERAGRRGRVFLHKLYFATGFVVAHNVHSETESFKARKSNRSPPWNRQKYRSVLIQIRVTIPKELQENH